MTRAHERRPSSRPRRGTAIVAALAVLAVVGTGCSDDAKVTPAAGGVATTASAGTAPPAAKGGQPTAILVNPIHDAQVVRGDDGMDHVEYELLVVSVVDQPVTLSSVAVLDTNARELAKIDGPGLTAATQTLFDKKPVSVISPSAAVSVDVDLVVPPGTAPERVTHRVNYSIPPGNPSAVMFNGPAIDGPEVAIDRRPATVIKSPVKGDGWLATTACCAPNVHRDLRIAIDGRRIETSETFAVDWAVVRDKRLYDGDGSTNEQYYAFGSDVFAVADGTVVSVQDGKPETTPNVAMNPTDKSDFGGNVVMLDIGPNLFAFYEHLQPGSLKVKVGDVVKAGAPLAKLGNTGPSLGPHLHFGLADKPDLFASRSLPFVIDSYTKAGTVDFAASEGDSLVITPESKPIQSAYPLYGGIQNFP